MKNIKIIPLKILLICLFYLNLFADTETLAQKNQTDSTTSLTFTAVGDIMCHSTQYEYARVGVDSFDFNPVYEEVKNFFEDRDVLMGNLETVTAGKDCEISGYPVFNSPDEFVTALSNTGFDILFTSNNHCLDKGRDGLLRTIEIIERHNIIPVGTFRSQEDKKRIKLINKNGIRFSVLAYTYTTNGHSNSSKHLAHISELDTLRISDNIKTSRGLGAEIVIVYLHFGKEYEREPNGYQRKIVKAVISSGADIIIASHPHVIQPVEMYKTHNATLDSGFVAYSLGNFISNQRWRYSDCTVALNFELTKDKTLNSIYISEFTYLPLWVFKGTINNKREYRLLPSYLIKDKNPQAYLTIEDLKLMRESFDDTKEIINKYSNKPVLMKAIK